MGARGRKGELRAAAQVFHSLTPKIPLFIVTPGKPNPAGESPSPPASGLSKREEAQRYVKERQNCEREKVSTMAPLGFNPL